MPTSLRKFSKPLSPGTNSRQQNNGANKSGALVGVALALFKHGRQRWAANLFWQATPPDAGRTAGSLYPYAKRKALELDGEVYAVRRGPVSQFGTGHTNDGDASEFGFVRALAPDVALLFDAKAANWIGVFEADADRFFLIAVNGGAIHPTLDLLGDRDTIVPALASALDGPEGNPWEKVYVPAGWIDAVADADKAPTPSLKTLLGSAKRLPKPVRLIAVNFRPPRRALALAGFAIALGLGFYAYNEYQASVEAAAAEQAAAQQRAALARSRENAQRTAAEEARRRTTAQQTRPDTAPPPPPPRPWIGLADPIDSLKACSSAIAVAPASVGGWNLTSAACTPGTITLMFRASPRVTVGNLLVDIPLASVDQQGNQATVSKTIQWPSPPAAEEISQLGMLFAEKMRLTDMAKRLDARISFTPVAPPTQGEGNTPPPPPPWRTESFQITTNLPVTAMEPLFVRPGIRLNRLTRGSNQAGSFTWTIEGTLYAR